jgi:hypothetical protein
MIASLADAWRWYESVRNLTLAMQQLGKKHWDGLPWEGDLGKDNRLRALTASGIVKWTEAAFEDLDDLCVLLLFSVFEAVVRTRVLTEVDRELSLLRHAAVRHAVTDLKDAIEHGSFFKVLEPYKGLDADLIEQLNQVRRYRNWVAHGRHGTRPDFVDPTTAYARLQSFLGRLNETAAAGVVGAGPGATPE